MIKHGKIPRRKRKSFYTNSYSKIRVKEDLIADKLQVGFIVRESQSGRFRFNGCKIQPF